GHGRGPGCVQALDRDARARSRGVHQRDNVETAHDRYPLRPRPPACAATIRPSATSSRYASNSRSPTTSRTGWRDVPDPELVSFPPHDGATSTRASGSGLPVLLTTTDGPGGRYP